MQFPLPLEGTAVRSGAYCEARTTPMKKSGPRNAAGRKKTARPALAQADNSTNFYKLTTPIRNPGTERIG